jgi:putative flavoprotein involved in K+ transport
VSRVDTVIVGAGQAGLALSYCLTASGHEHVLLERGQVAERWRSERWDSFRLLTPNWLTRLPGHRYSGPDPDGFMSKDEVVSFFDAYARSYTAPALTGVSVTGVQRRQGTWEVRTTAGRFDAHNVVVATGHYASPRLPALAADLPAAATQLPAGHYRNPAALPDGAVLVVGSGPTGQQIAGELARAGRRVFIAVGRHRPLPRRYRGADAYRWMERIGTLHRTIDSVAHRDVASREPSVVLSGGRVDLHLRRIGAEGVTPLGRLVGMYDGTLAFADDLAVTLAAADTRTQRFRDQVDDHIRRAGLAVPTAPPLNSAVPTWATRSPSRLDLRRANISTVIWATGYHRDYSWIHADVFDPNGEPVQRRGITAAPGLSFLGLRFMYRRNSNFIDGVGADAEHLADHIVRRRVEAVA